MWIKRDNCNFITTDFIEHFNTLFYIFYILYILNIKTLFIKLTYKIFYKKNQTQWISLVKIVSFGEYQLSSSKNIIRYKMLISSGETGHWAYLVHAYCIGVPYYIVLYFYRWLKLHIWWKGVGVEWRRLITWLPQQVVKSWPTGPFPNIQYMGMFRGRVKYMEWRIPTIECSLN